jgi:hypothetical protein
MIIALPLLVALVGVLMFALSTNAKLVRIGEIMFAAGLLVFLLDFHNVLTMSVPR